MTGEVDATEFADFATKLKSADKAVARGIRKRLGQIAKPLGLTVVREGSESMPARGGLRAHLLAGASASVLITGHRAALSLRTRGARLDGLNQGTLRHPVFGLRKQWAAQAVPADTYTGAFEQNADATVEQFEYAIEDALKELL